MERQEGLAVVSIARDDPSLNSRNIGGGHVCWGSYDGFNFAGWRLAVHAGALWAATVMRGKFGSDCET